MIDINSHAIFDVDSGAKSINQSIKMIKLASEMGYEGICLTPCYNGTGTKFNKAELISKIRTIKEILLKNNINLRLYLGEEVPVFPAISDYLDDFIYLNDSKYLLVEVPTDETVDYLEEFIFSVKSMGKIPIIAHPETKYTTKEDFDFLKKLYNNGVLFQVNLNSLVGHYGKDSQRMALNLLRADMVSLVSSNSHSVAGYLKANEGLRILKILVGDEKFKQLTDINPKRILANDLINNDFYVKKEKKKTISKVTKTKKHLTRDKIIVSIFNTFPSLEKLL